MYLCMFDMVYKVNLCALCKTRGTQSKNFSAYCHYIAETQSYVCLA